MLPCPLNPACDGWSRSLSLLRAEFESRCAALRRENEAAMRAAMRAYSLELERVQEVNAARVAAAKAQHKEAQRAWREGHERALREWERGREAVERAAAEAAAAAAAVKVGARRSGAGAVEGTDEVGQVKGMAAAAKPAEAAVAAGKVGAAGAAGSVGEVIGIAQVQGERAAGGEQAAGTEEEEAEDDDSSLVQEINSGSSSLFEGISDYPTWGGAERHAVPGRAAARVVPLLPLAGVGGLLGHPPEASPPISLSSWRAASSRRVPEDGGTSAIGEIRAPGQQQAVGLGGPEGQQLAAGGQPRGQTAGQRGLTAATASAGPGQQVARSTASRPTTAGAGGAGGKPPVKTLPEQPLAPGSRMVSAGAQQRQAFFKGTSGGGVGGGEASARSEGSSTSARQRPVSAPTGTPRQQQQQLGREQQQQERLASARGEGDEAASGRLLRSQRGREAAGHLQLQLSQQRERLMAAAHAVGSMNREALARLKSDWDALVAASDLRRREEAEAAAASAALLQVRLKQLL